MNPHSYRAGIAKLSIPVKRVGGHWEFFYGGDVRVHDGAVATLVVPESAIVDEKFSQRIKQQAVVRVLNEGAPLLVALSDRTAGAIPAELSSRINHEDLPSETTRLIKIHLAAPKTNAPARRLLGQDFMRGGLWLNVKGLDKTEIISSPIRMPEGCKENTAISLNHAFTMLSEQYETHRLSHTGNVYNRVFYQEENGYWYPLADLREGVLVNAQQQLLAETWRQIEVMLGWRPVVKSARKNK
jgi:hypothetical protein